MWKLHASYWIKFLKKSLRVLISESEGFNLRNTPYVQHKILNKQKPRLWRYLYLMTKTQHYHVTIFIVVNSNLLALVKLVQVIQLYEYIKVIKVNKHRDFMLILIFNWYTVIYFNCINYNYTFVYVWQNNILYTFVLYTINTSTYNVLTNSFIVCM